MMYWHNGSTSGVLFVVIAMMVVVGAVVFGAVARLRFNLLAGSSPVAEPAPELVLAERLAKGEIDVADYERRLSALHNDHPVTDTPAQAKAN